MIFFSLTFKIQGCVHRTQMQQLQVKVDRGITPDRKRWVRVMVFNATFNNITVTCISWRSVLCVEETRVPGENHLPAARGA